MFNKLQKPYVMVKFIQKIRRRRAQDRLLKSLSLCTEADLRRAAALQDFFRSVQLVPGDKLFIHFTNEGDMDLEVMESASDRLSLFKTLSDLK